MLRQIVVRLSSASAAVLLHAESDRLTTRRLIERGNRRRARGESATLRLRIFRKGAPTGGIGERRRVEVALLAATSGGVGDVERGH